VIDPDWATVHYAGAGHPPPLLLGPDGDAEYLWDGRSTPLGVAAGGTYDEGSARLDGGSTLALYTDGLVEVRGEMLTEGLDRLKEAVVSGPEDPKALCAHVIDSLLGSSGASDDVAFLALRTAPMSLEHLRLELPTNQAALGYARRLLRRWLEQAGATRAEAFDIQLASHEACANAIEHAYQFGENLVELEGQLIDGEVAVTVRDRGSWREQSPPERGNGIPLMKALMDGIDVNTGPAGTEVLLRRRLALSAAPAAVGARTTPAV
jgi:anti-sigma regulatory factor (Ser/Thr protein kinase)